jgi:hypothetical protein
MNLLEILYSVQHISQILAKPLEMSLEQYNSYLANAQNELFREYADGYMSGNGFEVDSRAGMALNPFKYVQPVVTFTSSSNGTFGFNASICALTSGCYKVVGVWVTTENAWDNPIAVDIVSHPEIVDRSVNSITKPSLTYPVGIIDNDNAATPTLSIIPQASWHARIDMLKQPTTPSLVIATVNGVASQDASSVALQLSTMFHTDVIRKILQYLGISVGNEFIQQAVSNQKNAEK